MATEQEEYEIVFNPHTKKGYYIRRVPYTRKHPTLAQQAQREAFAEAARTTIDEEGYRVVEGQLLPPGAAAVKEQLSGATIEKEGEEKEVEVEAEVIRLKHMIRQRKGGAIKLPFHVILRVLQEEKVKEKVSD